MRGMRQGGGGMGFSGMFGPTPEEVQEMQRQRAMNEEMAVAQMTPDQIAIMSGGMAGRKLGGGLNAVGRELGIPLPGNPQMEQAEKLQMISQEIQNSGINPTKPDEYLPMLGEKLAAAGMVKEAMSVGQALQAHKLKSSELDIKKYEADTARIRADAFKDSKLRSPLAVAIFSKNKEYTPESLEAYRKSIDEQNPDGNVSLLIPFQEPKGFEKLGTTDKGNFVFDDKTAQPKVRINGQLVPYDPREHGKAEGPGTKVNVGMPSIKIEQIDQRPPTNVVGEQNAATFKPVQTKALETLEQNASAAVSMQPDITRMRELARSGNLITGSLADQRVGLARLAVTMGNTDLAQKVNDTDFFNQFATEMLMPKMKMLGGNDSNQELKKMEDAVATNKLTPQQIVRSLDWLEDKNKKSLGKWNEFNTGRNNGRQDFMNFDAANGRWLDVEMQENNQVGYTRQAVETKDAPANPGRMAPVPAQPRRATYVTPQTPVATAEAGVPQQAQPAPVAPAAASPAPPENIVTKYMGLWKLPREQVIMKLMAERAARQGTQ